MARKRKIPPEVTDASEHETLKAETNGSSPSNKYKLRDLSARFTKSTTTADLDLSLCPRCRVIDLDTVVEAASAGEDLHGTIVAKITPYRQAVTTSTCRLCAFLSHDGLRSKRENDGYWRYRTKGPLKLCAFDSLTARGFARTKARIVETRSIVLVLLGPCERWYDYTSRQKLVLPCSWPRTAAQQPSSFLYCARKICTSSINYRLISGWLWDCESGHKSCRLQHPVMKPAKVIDCVQHEVVPCTRNTEYLALSYVWGKQSKRDKESVPTLGNRKRLDQIPKVILDAMSLVVSLGYKYLWVDRFCIDQDNAEEKHDQISRMDEVYEGALVTIVAASSKAADDGIPGFSVPRVMTTCFQVSAKLSLQACLPSVRQSLIESKWNERGWTYQEFCMSRRCLIFADDQAHFICRRGTTCEGVKEGALSSLPVAKWRCLNPSILEKGATSRSTSLFARHVSTYSYRTLSYDSDKLNAFRGVLSRSQIASYWGVPVFNTDLTPRSAPASVEVRDLAPFHLGFSTGLCWTRDWRSRAQVNPQYDSGKSNGLPSWSWVSCRGTISPAESIGYEKRNDELWISECSVKCFAEVYLNDPSSTKQDRLIALTRPYNNRSRMIYESSPFIFIRSIVKTMEEEDMRAIWMEWDSGNEPKCSAFPFFLILLVYKHTGLPDGKYCCMVVKMEGDVARRVGLAWPHVSVYSSLTSLGLKTIKVG